MMPAICGSSWSYIVQQVNMEKRISFAEIMAYKLWNRICAI